MPNRTIIIAEAGVNHNGDLALARRLVREAATAGADLVKFQTFSADRIAVRTAAKAQYQQATTGSDESQYAMLKRLELTEAMHDSIRAECQSAGIEFLSTAFDVESLEYLVRLGVRYIKVASGELTNVPFLRRAARLKMPVIMSTGMATLGEIETAVSVLETSGCARSNIVALHCNTEYPTPMHDVNLRAMTTIGEALGVPVGYSDHTLGIEVPIAAVARGARVIEKHFTLDRTLPGPDHAASLEPVELGAMVRSIRNIEQALGDPIKRPSISEQNNIAIARKSIVAARPIRAGERFTEENLTVKRPGNGISPLRWDEVLALTARRDFSADEMISL